MLPTAAGHFEKGIVLAGGSGTRLYPLTQATCKQLLPVYDKPMIYYPLSALMLGGIRQILVISTPQDVGGFQRLLGRRQPDRHCRSAYAVQPRPEGLAQALIIGRAVRRQRLAWPWSLGDNLFYGQGFQPMLDRAVQRADRGHDVRLSGQRSAALRRGGTRRRRPARCRSKKSRASRSRTMPCRGCISTTTRCSTSPPACALGARRAGNHRRQSRVSAAGPAARRAVHARLRLARHRHARVADASRQLRANGRRATRVEDRLHRGNCLAQGLYLPRQLERLGAAIPNDYGQYLLDLLASRLAEARQKSRPNVAKPP